MIARMTPENPVINMATGANRIAKSGKIESYPFTLDSIGRPFTIFVKTNSTEVGTITGKLYQDSESHEIPVVSNDWTPLMIQSIDSTSGFTSPVVYYGTTLIN